jgi:hypothetical protein
MATFKEYYMTDFANAITHELSFQITPDSHHYEISAKIGIEAYSGATFIAYYLPYHHDYLSLIKQLITDRQNALEQARDLDINFKFSADVQAGLIGSSHAVFSNRIYVYAENDLSDSDVAHAGRSFQRAIHFARPERKGISANEAPDRAPIGLHIA